MSDHTGVFSSESDPSSPKVVDEMLSAIFETETKNYHANRYALDVVKYYHGTFIDDDWFANWIGTEEFRGGKYPDGFKFPKRVMRRYENMYSLYWTAYSEWFAIVIQNIAIQNMRELQRNAIRADLINETSWKRFGKLVQRFPKVTHYDREDD